MGFKLYATKNTDKFLKKNEARVKTTSSAKREKEADFISYLRKKEIDLVINILHQSGEEKLTIGYQKSIKGVFKNSSKSQLFKQTLNFSFLFFKSGQWKKT